MKKFLFVFLFVLFAAGGFLFTSRDSQADEPVIEEVVEVEPEVQVVVEEYLVTEDDTFTTVTDYFGIPYADALAIVDTAEGVFDFTSIKVGKPFRLVSEDGVVTRLEYEPGTEYFVSVDLLAGFVTTKEAIAYDLSIERAEVTISESLFVSGLNAGLSEVLLLDFVEIFAWDVDFATQVQVGDTYTILYEKRSRDGEEAGVGDVLYGNFVNVGEVSEAFRFVDPEGETSYYDPEGRSLAREFLRAPLSYSRISSGYTNARFHPVVQRNMPHRAIDYAAPYGTPIVAVADGTVTYAGWNGGYGNYIDIRHNSVYETQYAHLSSMTVSYGERVEQGKVIGYVGSTGWSTGPHLHYQVQVNGSLMNPLEVDFPKGDPLSDELLPMFEEQKRAIQAQM